MAVESPTALSPESKLSHEEINRETLRLMDRAKKALLLSPGFNRKLVEEGITGDFLDADKGFIVEDSGFEILIYTDTKRTDGSETKMINVSHGDDWFLLAMNSFPPVGSLREYRQGLFTFGTTQNNKEISDRFTTTAVEKIEGLIQKFENKQKDPRLLPLR